MCSERRANRVEIISPMDTKDENRATQMSTSRARFENEDQVR
jgi:hypothetical protein